MSSLANEKLQRNESSSGKRRFTFLFRSKSSEKTSLQNHCSTPTSAIDLDPEYADIADTEVTSETPEKDVTTTETTTVITIKDEGSSESDSENQPLTESTSDTMKSSETGDSTTKIVVSDESSLPPTPPIPAAIPNTPPSDPNIYSSKTEEWFPGPEDHPYPSTESSLFEKRKSSARGNLLSASKRIRNTLTRASKKRGPSKKDVEKSLERAKAAYASMRRIEDYTEFFQTRKEKENESVQPPRRGSDSYRTFSFGHTSPDDRGLASNSAGFTSRASTFKQRPRSAVFYGERRPGHNFRLNGDNFYAGSALSLAPNCIYSDQNRENFSFETNTPQGRGLFLDEEQYFLGRPVQLSVSQPAMSKKAQPAPGRPDVYSTRRPSSPFYESPQEESRFSKNASDQEDKLRFRRAANPLYSSMPKLNGSSYQSGRWAEAEGPKMRPAASWGHLGPSDRMFNAYNQNQFLGYPESLQRQYQYQQNSAVFRNIFPYTTLYGRRVPAKYPTIQSQPAQPRLDQYSFRRLPPTYKRYYSQSNRRSSMMGATSQSLRFPATNSSRKAQPSVYEVFADENHADSDGSFSGGGQQIKANPVPVHLPPCPPSVFFLPQTNELQGPPPPSFGENSSTAELEEKIRRRKRSSRNCMIGWMLGLTALIILALAIALFIQVSKDANELNKLRSAVAAEIAAEEQNFAGTLPQSNFIRR